MADTAKVMSRSLKEKLQSTVNAMRAEREDFVPQYKELARFVQPRRGRFFVSDRNKGGKGDRYTTIINSKATMAHRIARSGILAGTMSPSRAWFDLETQNPELMELAEVRLWLHQSVQVIRAILNESNFYSMAPVAIGELLQFGTACMTHEDDFENVARFYTHTVGSYMLAQNDRLEIDTLAREFEWSVWQIVSKFGYKQCSSMVQRAYDQGNYEAWYPVTHVIMPNDKHERGSKLSDRKRFLSTYYEPGRSEGDEQVLSKKGFDEFPAYCPRWDVTGEDIYGTDCPGMTALGDVKHLQIVEKRKAQAIDKQVNPPLKGPPSLNHTEISSLPGGITTYQADAIGERLGPIYEVRPDLSGMREDRADVQARIDEAYYVPLFLAISHMEGIQPRNELDLMHRNEERLLQIGPVLERIHREFAGPMIDRVFMQAAKAGILPPAPDELQGRALRVKYISPLAMAQRAVATGDIDRMATFVGVLLSYGFEEARDKFNTDEAIDEYGDAIGAPPRVVRSQEQVVEIRQRRAQEEAQAKAIALAQSGANVTKMLSDSKTGEDNALTAITGGAG